MFKKILLTIIVCGLFINSVSAYNLNVDFDTDRHQIIPPLKINKEVC